MTYPSKISFNASDDSLSSNQVDRQLMDEEEVIDPIENIPPSYEFLSPETIEKVEEWSAIEAKTNIYVLNCMGRISKDFYEQGMYREALETIQEAWDCDREGSCDLSALRHATLELLRARCYAKLQDYPKALESCKAAKRLGSLEADSFEHLITQGMKLLSMIDK